MIDEKKLIEIIKNVQYHMREANKNPVPVDAREIFTLFIEMVEQQPKVSEWIPCNESLPKKPEFGEDSYLVQSKIVKTPYTAYWDGEKWSDVLDEKIFDVIAWMPLPPTYKPKQKEG